MEAKVAEIIRKILEEFPQSSTATIVIQKLDEAVMWHQRLVRERQEEVKKHMGQVGAAQKVMDKSE